ncbi:MAG: deoxyhypusine synthase, partial [Nitrospina sp.]|nr:deoxyhypusine synthase [Nitrospina sp.]
MKDDKDQYLKGKRISPTPIKEGLGVKGLIDNHFNGFNAARIQELCHLISEKMSPQNVYVGFSLSGALTP